jgi:SulP family sulfate permease
MAYAELAGLPAYVGLYAAAVPPLAASFFASSPYLQTGPVALTSLLTLGALGTLAAPQSAEYIGLAALLALVVGAARLLLGLLRLGVLAYLMSEPVVTGFTSAAAVLICASQLPTVLGADPPDGGILEQAWWAVVHPATWETAAMVMAVLTAAVMAAGRRLHPLFPGVLVAVVLGIAYSTAAGYDGMVLGDIPSGLPMPNTDFPWGDLPRLLVPGIVIALVGFAEPASIARTFAAADRRPWSPNREFISQGAANLASAAVGAFPVGGSFSRSSLNRVAGARSRWSGAVTGLCVLAFLPAAAVFEPLPRAVLGAIVIMAAIGLIRPLRMIRLWGWSRPQGLVAGTTFVATLALSPNVEWAVIFGVVAATAVHLWRELHVEVDVTTDERSLVVRPRGVFWFGSAPKLEQLLVDQLADNPDVTRILLDLGGVGRLDLTAATVLKTFIEEAGAAGLDVDFTGVPPQTRRILDSMLGERPR